MMAPDKFSETVELLLRACDATLAGKYAESNSLIESARKTIRLRTLILPLKRRWFEQILGGQKSFEYRLKNAYWTKRLVGKHYDRVIFMLGYPKRDDTARRIVAPYRGYVMKTVTSDEWGNKPQKVFAILTPNHPEF